MLVVAIYASTLSYLIAMSESLLLIFELQFSLKLYDKQRQSLTHKFIVNKLMSKHHFFRQCNTLLHFVSGKCRYLLLLQRNKNIEKRSLKSSISLKRLCICFFLVLCKLISPLKLSKRAARKTRASQYANPLDSDIQFNILFRQLQRQRQRKLNSLHKLVCVPHPSYHCLLACAQPYTAEDSSRLNLAGFGLSGIQRFPGLF